MTAPPGVGAIVEADRAVAETVRLLEEFQRAVPSSLPWAEPWRRGIAAARDAARSGHLDGALWIGPKDEAIAVATWGPPGRAGRAVTAYLTEGYRTPAALGSLVRALDATEPIRVLHGPVLGLDDASVTGALAPLDLRPVQRQDLQLPESAEVRRPEVPPGLPLRNLTAADVGPFARLMERGYSDAPVDRWLFAQDPDPRADADRAAAFLLSDRLGPWRPDASYGIEGPGGLVAATLVHELQGPLISEVVVDPAFRRRGLARLLIAATVAAVRERGLGAPRLVVTVGNDRAEPLYHSLGFVPTAARGTLWLRWPWTGSR